MATRGVSKKCKLYHPRGNGAFTHRDVMKLILVGYMDEAEAPHLRTVCRLWRDIVPPPTALRATAACRYAVCNDYVSLYRWLRNNGAHYDQWCVEQVGIYAARHDRVDILEWPCHADQLWGAALFIVAAAGNAHSSVIEWLLAY